MNLSFKVTDLNLEYFYSIKKELILLDVLNVQLVLSFSAVGDDLSTRSYKPVFADFIKKGFLTDLDFALVRWEEQYRSLDQTQNYFFTWELLLINAGDPYFSTLLKKLQLLIQNRKLFFLVKSSLLCNKPGYFVSFNQDVVLLEPKKLNVYDDYLKPQYTTFLNAPRKIQEAALVKPRFNSILSYSVLQSRLLKIKRTHSILHLGLKNLGGFRVLVKRFRSKSIKDLNLYRSFISFYVALNMKNALRGLKRLNAYKAASVSKSKRRDLILLKQRKDVIK